MKRLSKIAACIIFAVSTIFTISCNNRQAQSKVESINNTKWQLTELNNKEIAPVVGRFTITFDGQNAISGKGACNTIAATYKTAKDNEINISNIASTRMMCPDMENELEFVKMLDNVTHYNIDGRTLTLLNNDTATLIFKRAE